MASPETDTTFFDVVRTARVVTGKKDGKVALYFVMPTNQGWKQRFWKGDLELEGLDCDYVCGESEEQLRSWWRCDFDRHEFTKIPLDDESDAMYSYALRS